MSTTLDKRIAPQMQVDKTGKITWTEVLNDFDAATFYRGKTVTDEEFKKLFLRSVYQSNYNADTLALLFNSKLRDAVSNTFRNEFHLRPSYVKIFTMMDWGEQHEDGYYYITIPASEHGIEKVEVPKPEVPTIPDDVDPSMQVDALEEMNIDTEMYLLDNNNNFYEVTQVNVTSDNTVILYTDDNTIPGFAVVRTNDRSYALANLLITDAAQVKGLAEVATSGKYTDLFDRPDERIQAIEDQIAAITSSEDSTVVNRAAKADLADESTNAGNLTTSIRNQPLTAIFEDNSTHVKNATNATNATNYNTSEGTIKTKFDSIEEKLTRMGFKQGSMTDIGGWVSDITKNEFKRQGNYVLGELSLRWQGSGKLGSISPEFRPKIINTDEPYVTVYLDNIYHYTYQGFTLDAVSSIRINANGDITVHSSNSNIWLHKVSFGYEAEPLTT